MTDYRILTLYRFVPLVVPDHCIDGALSSDAVDQLAQLQTELRTTLRKSCVKGTILIAPEGVNGTICYPFTPCDDHNEGDPVERYLTSHPLFGGPLLRRRTSINDGQAFQRLKVKIKKEIVTIGPNRYLANPLALKGKYLSSSEWDEMAILDPDVLVIDTRNTYEVGIGTFEGAIDPNTNEFHELPNYLEKLAKAYDWGANTEKKTVEEKKDDGGAMRKMKSPPKAIAMFCTGGIRCEKSTSYALQSGLFPKDLPIYHLEGGILAYLDHVAEKKRECHGVDDDDDGSRTESTMVETVGRSTFKGECFVFDNRVAVTEGLKPTTKYVSCHGCRGPMDRRLLEPLFASSIGDDVNDVGKDRIDTEFKRFRELAQGIPDLPQLRCDSVTTRFYLPGLTCPRCHASTTKESLERFIERERQVEIANREGKPHFQDLGGTGVVR